MTDYQDHDSAATPLSLSVDSESQEITSIYADHGRFYIGEIMSAAIREIHRQEAQDAIYLA